jgi:hypothetical protein
MYLLKNNTNLQNREIMYIFNKKSENPHSIMRNFKDRLTIDKEFKEYIIKLSNETESRITEF